MPAARGQSAEQRRFRGFAVEVKRLGIELRCERLDLRLIDRMGAARKTLAHAQILEEKFVQSRLVVCVHDCCPIVNCIMIVTSLYCVNAAQELRPDGLPDCPQSRARERVVEHSHSALCPALAHALRSIPEKSRDRAE